MINNRGAKFKLGGLKDHSSLHCVSCLSTIGRHCDTLVLFRCSVPCCRSRRPRRVKRQTSATIITRAPVTIAIERFVIITIDLEHSLDYDVMHVQQYACARVCRLFYATLAVAYLPCGSAFTTLPSVTKKYSFRFVCSPLSIEFVLAFFVFLPIVGSIVFRGRGQSDFHCACWYLYTCMYD